MMRNGPISSIVLRSPSHSADAEDFLAPLGIKTWRGASGRHYLHTIYGLTGCPAFEHGCYLLIRFAGDGRRIVLDSGRSKAQAASLNLAEVRQRAALLGAPEIHLLCLSSELDAVAAEFDLASALLSPAAKEQSHY